jgi:hypothetical protein
VVVRDLDVLDMAILPAEADSVLLVDADAVLAFPVAAESLEPVARWRCEFEQRTDSVQLVELAPGHWPELSWTGLARRRRTGPVEDVRGAGTTEASYHGMHYNA